MDMKKDFLRRFEALVDTHGFFNDLQICPCEFEVLGGFDAKTLAAELIEHADNGNYGEEDCNYRPIKWIEKAIMMSERLIGTREGDVLPGEIERIVHEIYPEYEKECISFKEAEGLLRKKITKMVESSIKAKQHFFVFPENPGRWIEIRPFFEGQKIDEKQLSRALWAYSDGFNKIDREYEENRAELKAFFTEYPDFCYDAARAKINDRLIQYNDALRKLEMIALADRIIRKLAETGEKIEPQLSDSAYGIAKKLYLKAGKFEKDIIKALESAYTHPKLEEICAKENVLVLPYSKGAADALRPIDLEDAPHVELINWEKSREEAAEAQEYVIGKLEENFKRAETSAKQLSRGYIADTKNDTAYFIGF